MKLLFSTLLVIVGAILSPQAVAEKIYLDEMAVMGISVGWGTPQKNLSVAGKPLTIGANSYKRGVGVHAESVAIIRLHGTVSRFQSLVGVDGSVKSAAASVEFIIYGDDKELFRSGVMRANTAAKKVDLSLAGIKTLKLQVSSATNGISSDHANWVNSCFTYNGKCPEIYLGEWTEAQTTPATSQNLLSPNGKIKFHLFHDKNLRLSYSVTKAGKHIINPSPLGITVNSVHIGKRVEYKLLSKYAVNETSACRGKHSTAHDKCNGAKFLVKDLLTGKTCILEVRSYDDGVCLRYLAVGHGELELTADATGFSFAENSKIWASLGNEEGIIHSGIVQGNSPLFKGKPFMPITAELPNKCIVAVMEAARNGSSAVRVCKEFGKGRLKVVLCGPAKNNDKIATPWRVIKISADLNGLVNNDIIHNLSKKPDHTLFPQGVNTPWIKPGKIGWSWMEGGGEKGVNLVNQKLYVDYAQKMKYEYVLVDEGWKHWNEQGQYDCEVRNCKKSHGDTPWVAVKKLVDYANARGVKIWLWKAFDNRRGVPGIRNPKARAHFFKQCNKFGVVGVKLDFFPAPSQQIIQWQEATLKEAAKYKLMVNFHGCATPSGEVRTYPNEMTREAIRGLEFGGGHHINQTVRLPFNRLLCGHGDYTPLWARHGGANLPNHIATVAIIDSSVVHFCQHPKTILSWGKEQSELVMGIPLCWDETVVLPQSKIGDTVVMARRKGKNWYLAVLTAVDSDLTINLDFLSKSKKYQLTEVLPGKNPYTQITLKKRDLSQTDKVNLKLKRGEGYLGRFQLK